MDRIKGAGHVNNRFVSEDAQDERPPTELTAEWFNNVQEELCYVIEQAGITLNENDQTQLLQAIKKITPVMTGATNETSGQAGTVPAPAAGDENKVLTGSGEWKYLSGIAIGQEVMHYGTIPPPGCLVCDGSAVGRQTYPELYAVIGTTYGEGDGETTFNLPNRIGRFGQGSLTPGQYIDAGLPNITGFVYADTQNNAGAFDDGGGAFWGSESTSGRALASVEYERSRNRVLNVDASRSSPIYGNSNTVQPPALTLLPCIKAFDATVNPGLIDITELANDLNGKADTSLDNISVTGIEKAIRWIAPDYSAKVDYTSQWGVSIPANEYGWVWVRSNATLDSPVEFSTDLQNFTLTQNGDTSVGTGSGNMFFVLKGTAFTATGGNGQLRQLYFFPVLGV